MPPARGRDEGHHRLLEGGLPSLRGRDRGPAGDARQLEFQIEELDITSEDSLHRAYFDRIPVISLEGEEICEHFLQEALVRERLESRR